MKPFVISYFIPTLGQTHFIGQTSSPRLYARAHQSDDGWRQSGSRLQLHADARFVSTSLSAKTVSLRSTRRIHEYQSPGKNRREIQRPKLSRIHIHVCIFSES